MILISWNIIQKLNSFLSKIYNFYYYVIFQFLDAVFYLKIVLFVFKIKIERLSWHTLNQLKKF